jgi:phosphatidylinositol kinase/protein kinase (PI-3  family)
VNYVRKKVLNSETLFISLLSDIRTYAVVPLNEECGLIEWVPNTMSFRSVILKLWKANGITVQVRRLHYMCYNC